MMLKRIHFAKPTIRYDEYQRHAAKAERLSVQMRNKGRYAVV